MSERASIQSALRALELCATHTAGFRHDALDPAAIRRLLENELDQGASAQQIEAACQRLDERLLAGLHQVVSVGETYFYRHPEHFAALAGGGIPAAGRSGQGIRAWSAGCATGEEAWSLAGMLLAIAPEDRPPQVLGSDLLESNISAALVGTYRRWSLRNSAPLLQPVVKKHSDGNFHIQPHLREITRFIRHNLLSPPPEKEHFDLIFCRNVLVYFTPQAREQAVHHLIDAALPGALLAFGPMDLPEHSYGLIPLGSSDQQLYRKPERPFARTRSALGRHPAPRRARAQKRERFRFDREVAVELSRELSGELSGESSRGFSRESVSDSSSDSSRDQSRTQSRTQSKAQSKDHLRELSIDLWRDSSRVPSRDSSRDSSRDPSSKPSKQTSRTASLGSVQDSAGNSGGSSAGALDARRWASRETSPPGASSPIRIHLQALAHLESGELKQAESLLIEALALAPHYIPGLVETALLRARVQDSRGASELMRRVLQLALRRDEEEVLSGPEPLPLRFYVASAAALLERYDGKH